MKNSKREVKMDQGAELIMALKQISREKGIDEGVIFEAIENSLLIACKKNFGSTANSRIQINRETGSVEVFAQKNVVEEVADPNTEITEGDARKVNIRYSVGDIADVPVTPRNFGRISAQTAKQVVVQKFREAERELLYNEFVSKEREAVTGIVQRRDRKNVIVSLGRIDAYLPPSEQIPNERYETHDRMKFFVSEVRQTAKGPIINVSRTNPELVKRLFEQEVPEVFDGTVEIRSIARDPGSRSKIAVYSRNPNVDPVGSCVGQNGFRVNVVVSELNGEKIDIIEWSESPEKYIAAALSPSEVISVIADPEEQSAKIVVPDNKLSLAIGKAGQNAKLAARLTGWRIDIKNESQAREEGFMLETPFQAFAGLYENISEEGFYLEGGDRNDQYGEDSGSGYGNYDDQGYDDNDSGSDNEGFKAEGGFGGAAEALKNGGGSFGNDDEDFGDDNEDFYNDDLDDNDEDFDNDDEDFDDDGKDFDDDDFDGDDEDFDDDDEDFDEDGDEDYNGYDDDNGDEAFDGAEN